MSRIAHYRLNARLTAATISQFQTDSNKVCKLHSKQTRNRVLLEREPDELVTVNDCIHKTNNTGKRTQDKFIQLRNSTEKCLTFGQL